MSEASTALARNPIEVGCPVEYSGKGQTVTGYVFSVHTDGGLPVQVNVGFQTPANGLVIVPIDRTTLMPMDLHSYRAVREACEI